MYNFFIGMFIGVAVAYLANRVRALNRGGAIAAAVLGTIVLGLGGSGWALVILTFFISSSLLSKFFRTRKTATEGASAKGSNRDAWQVLANGGVAGAATLIYFVVNYINPSSGLISFLWVVFASSLAGANADTWGTELGLLNPRQPVLLTNLRRVPQGTSGGVSLMGTLAALAGSALVGGVATLAVKLGWAPPPAMPLGKVFAVITTGGLLGSLVDSLLGATLQVIYQCPSCKKLTEKHPLHTCGTQTVYQHGLPWLNNDWVNFLCTLSAALVGGFLFIFYNN